MVAKGEGHSRLRLPAVGGSAMAAKRRRAEELKENRRISNFEGLENITLRLDGLGIRLIIEKRFLFISRLCGMHIFGRTSRPAKCLCGSTDPEPVEGSRDPACPAIALATVEENSKGNGWLNIYSWGERIWTLVSVKALWKTSLRSSWERSIPLRYL